MKIRHTVNNGRYCACRAVKELFLEQLRVIDSHPYENVGDDGRPLIDGESVIPDYETIFVKGKEMQRVAHPTCRNTGADPSDNLMFDCKNSCIS